MFAPAVTESMRNNHGFENETEKLNYIKFNETFAVNKRIVLNTEFLVFISFLQTLFSNSLFIKGLCNLIISYQLFA